MTRRDHYAVKIDEGGEIAVIGPRQPHPEYGIYLRIEGKSGEFIGAIRGRKLHGLARRLAAFVLAPRRGSRKRGRGRG